MRKFLMLLLLVPCIHLFAQSYPITSITISLPANPDANTVKWGTGTSILSITAVSKAVNGRIDPHVQESKILVTIKKGGSKICGSYSGNNAPTANFNSVTKVWSGSNAVSFLGQDCTLPPGEYELCVQFFGFGSAAPTPISDEKCKPFTIRGKEEQNYQPPQNIAPANETLFSELDAKKPVTFRWTPVIPKPTEPVTYQLRVWQLMQGQSGTQAMKSNQPIITKDVTDLTQAIVTNILTGPCKPPYLCDFVWNVQALNRDGKPIGTNNGTSEPFTFRITSTDETIQPPKLLTPKNGDNIPAGQDVRFTWLPPTPTSTPVTYRIKIVEIKGDESPENALRTNKPFFEKDSPSLITNKPFFEKDSLSYFKRGSKYAWNVQAIGRDGKPVGSNNGTSEAFSFKATSTDETIQPPKLLTPKNGDSIPAGQEVRFSWLPPMPTPAAPVTYKIKIIEIKGDQSPEEAFRTNKPFFEKDSIGERFHKGNKPFFEKDSISKLRGNKPFFEKDSLNYFKPGSKYAWNVQAVDREGKPVGGNNGTSENFVFKMMQAGCQATLKITKDSCLGPDKNGMYKHRMCATYTADPANTCNVLFNNPTNNTTNNFGMFQSGQSNIFFSKTPGTSTSNFSPALGTLPATLAPGASVSFCFDLLAPTSYTGVKFTAFGFCDDNSGNFNTANANDTIPLKQCICDPCKEMGVSVIKDEIQVKDPAADEVTLFGQLSGLDPNKIKKVTIELVYFNIEQTGDKECAKCTENKQWGNFVLPATTFFKGFGTGVLNGGNFGREWTWISKIDKDCSGNNGHGDGGNGGVGDPKNLCASCPGGSKTTDDKAGIMPNPGDVIILPGPTPAKLNTFSLPISLPPGSSLSCCSDKVTICIRYTWWDFCCHACDVIKCYTFERKPAKSNPNPSPNK